MKFLILALFICFAWTPMALAEKLPDSFTLQKITSKSKIRSKNWKEKFTVMQFWASWCEGCSTNMKKVAQWKKARKLPFKHIAVSVDETFAEAKKYVDELPTQYKKLRRISFFDKGTELASGLDIEAVPATLVVNSRREIVGKIIGTLDKDKMKQLKRLIKKGERK